MTDAQVRYHQMMEAKRHDLEQEQNWRDQLTVSMRNADVQAEASRYATDTNAGTQRYVSDQNARVQTQLGYLNAATSRYATDTNAMVSRYATNTNAETQRYVSDQNATTQRYAADLQAATAANRLEFEKQTQDIVNSLNAKKFQLERDRATADISNIRASTQKLIQDTANSVQAMEIKARELGLAEEAAQFNNALTVARKWESYAKTANLTADVIGKIWDGITTITDIIGDYTGAKLPLE